MVSCLKQSSGIWLLYIFQKGDTNPDINNNYILLCKKSGRKQYDCSINTSGVYVDGPLQSSATFPVPPGKFKIPSMIRLQR